ncbi:MAG: hypothetical protein ABI537_09875 [Casimicrobiaceae bacterium]
MGTQSRRDYNEVDMPVTYPTNEAQRIALAEKLLSEQASAVLMAPLRIIEERCKIAIGEICLRLRHDSSAGPEPVAHCVIIDAHLKE